MMFDVLVMMAVWTISVVSGEEIPACPSGTFSANLTTPADMQSLTDAMNCSGQGVFNVTLYSSVQIKKRIEVSNQKILYITGSGFPTIRAAPRDNTEPSAVTDAGNTTGIFFVSGGSTLTINALTLQGGCSEDGGAVAVLSSSSLHAFDCSFQGNNATTGGAIYAEHSEVHILGTTRFSGNSADFGGAISGYGSELSVVGNTSFLGNLALLYGGTLSMDVSHAYVVGTTSFVSNVAAFGGAIQAYGGSRIFVDGNASFANNSASHAGGAMYLENGCVANIDGCTSFATNSAQDYGGAIFLEQECTIDINGNTYFTHNSATSFGGAVCAESGSVINMHGNTYFGNNSARFHGGGIYQENSNFTIDGNASFVNNTAANGGAIESYAGSIILSFEATGWFTGNDAAAGGGAIYLSAPDEVKITNTAFASNTAKSGGAIALEGVSESRRVYENCSFIDNMATDGGAVYFYGGAGLDYVSGSLFRNNYASNGGAVFSAGTLDVISTSFLANNAEREGMAIFIASVFSSSRVEFANTLFADNDFRCPLGEYSYDDIDASVSRFEMVCRGCSVVADTIPDGVRIDEDRAAPSCTGVPRGTVGVLGDTTIASLTLEKGYFRTSNESGVVVECYRSEACVGGNDPDKYCADGYEGPYCSLCAKGFSRGIAHSCRECSDEAMESGKGLTLTVAVVVLLVAALVLRSLGTVLGDGVGDENDLPQGVAISRCSSCQGLAMKVLPLSSIKIVLVVWQIVFQISSIAEAVYPRQYEMFLSYLSFANFDIAVILWFSCFVSTDFYDRLLIATIAPLLVLLVLAGGYCVAKKKYRNSNRGMLVVRNQYISAALFVLFFVYSSVSSTIFQTFRCDLLDNSILYLQADYSLTCSSAKHETYTAYASLMLVVYPLGIPALFFWWLVRNRKYLEMSGRHTMEHLEPFNSIWGTYRPRRYYYELIECCRRISLSASSVFFFPDSLNQIAIVLSLALVFLFISESMSPFERNADANLYRWGNGVILASMYVALVMKADASSEESGRQSVLGWVLITANMVMVVAVIIETVLFAQEWLSSLPVTEEIIPPVRRYPSVTLRGTESVHTVLEEEDMRGQTYVGYGLSGREARVHPDDN